MAIVIVDSNAIQKVKKKKLISRSFYGNASVQIDEIARLGNCLVRFRPSRHLSSLFALVRKKENFPSIFRSSFFELMGPVWNHPIHKYNASDFQPLALKKL